MIFATKLSRALLPVAVISAAPALAAKSADMAQLGSHLTAVKTMSANFTQTDQIADAPMVIATE